MMDMDWQAFGAEHPTLLLFAVFLTAFAESLAFVGLIVPGVVLLVLLAGAAQWAGLSIWWLLSAGFLGAIIGDVLSFYWGARRREGIWEASFVKRYRPWLERGTTFFERWGWASILVGRFVGPVRPVVPVVAGVLGMPPRHFWLVDFIACLAWAPIYLLPGYWAGQVVSALPELAPGLLWLLLCFMCVYGVCVWWLQSPNRCAMDCRSGRFLVGVAMVSFCILSWGAAAQWWPIEGVHIALVQAQIPLINPVMRWVTHLGDAVILAPFGVCVGLLLSWRFSWSLAWRWLLQLVIGLSIFTVMKWLLQVPRPAEFLLNDSALAILPRDPAFPSGHTWMAVLIWLGLVMWVPWPLGRIRQVVIWGGGAFALMIACSRLYLGVHWWPDVSAALVGAIVQAMVARHYSFNLGRVEGAYMVGASARKLALGIAIAWFICLLAVSVRTFGAG